MTRPSVMVPVIGENYHTTPSYLVQYLLTTNMTTPEIDGLTDAQADVFAIAAEMLAEYAVCYSQFAYLDLYYIGYPPLVKEPVRLTTKYRELLRMGISNWLGLVVDVVDERLQIQSIASTKDSRRDPTAWKWWQANNMDGTSSQIHLSALKYGVCYASVWPQQDKDHPKLMGESPLTTHVRFDDDEVATAAIRVYRAECCDDKVNIDLTLPDWQFRLTTAEPIQVVQRENYGMADFVPTGPFGGGTLDLTGLRLTYRDDVPPVVRNPLGAVPYVRLRTMPDLLGGYRSEIEGLTPIQDRINKTIFDRLITQEFAAFPQRWVTGIEVPVDPQTGKPREPFNAAVDRVWTLAAPDGAFGQFDAADLKGYLDAVTADVQALATQSRTPPHYLIAGMGTFPSGESVRATESGLTRKVQARQRSYGDGWQRLLHLAALTEGDTTLADDPELNVVWADTEARSESELVDALLKMGSLNVPVEALWQRWGATPNEVQQWAQEAKARAAALPSPSPTTNQQPNPTATPLLNPQTLIPIPPLQSMSD